MPLRSMTAYGEATITSLLGQLTCQIQSTNRRHLEITTHLPRAFVKFEIEGRKILSASIGRGQIYLHCTWKGTNKNVAITPNIAFAQEMQRGWGKIAEELQLPNTFSLHFLQGEEELFINEEKGENETELFSLFTEVIHSALKKHIEMREKEGEAIFSELQSRCALLEKIIKSIEARLPEVITTYREKLQKKIEDIFQKSEELEERVLKELAFFAEKADIAEEILRFKTHLEAFQETLKSPLSPAETKGKKMEFQLQELGREINTIGSKSVDATITQWVIESKSELEKIREQTQNIE